MYTNGWHFPQHQLKTTIEYLQRKVCVTRVLEPLSYISAYSISFMVLFSYIFVLKKSRASWLLQFGLHSYRLLRMQWDTFIPLLKSKVMRNLMMCIFIDAVERHTINLQSQFVQLWPEVMLQKEDFCSSMLHTDVNHNLI